MTEPASRKYLEKYAEPEARFAGQLEQPYGAALVVPVHGEDVSFLDDLAPALAAGSTTARVLLILVVNATDAAPAETHDANEKLLAALRQRLLPRQELEAIVGSPAAAILGRPAGHDVLLVDRASAGRRLPDRQGVGLARRIGMDLALALYAQGRVRSRWLGCTDADARLPDDYFAQNASTAAIGPSGRRVGLTLPFLHVPGGDAAIDAATAIYEISLRYYTLGLASAGSPYAYESMGSSIVTEADAYAEVRGFPKREAGEDFYLLDKLAKVGSLHRPNRAPILLRSRTSTRVPFGTGARVREVVAAGGALTTYHPRVFELLRAALTSLRLAVRERDEAAVPRELSQLLDAGSVGAVSTVLDELGALEALRDSFGASPDARVRERRLLTWFDALRSLRFIHLIEVAAGLSRLGVIEAVGAAPFCDFWRPSHSRQQLRTAVFSAEQSGPSEIGVESAISGRVNAP